MLSTEDYKDSEGNIDYEKYNADMKKLRQDNHRRALSTFNKAYELAKLNGACLKRCTSWHYQLTVNNFIYNLYPANQRIYIDLKHKGPFLEVPHPWTFLDVVAKALFINTLKPRQIAEQING